MSMVLASGSAERGSVDLLEQDEQFTVTITIPGTATVDEYDTFNLQLIPATGAALTIQRTMPANLKAVMDLQ